ncbi:MAG: ATP-binding cassette domain-containing protein [Carboxylicivirga sp.]|jgi:putative ABC transport system ATP-binding protein|nr:ATP-binding cassette domain-containing protein [Carboxylicivirga sp.]MCT4647813.1 ATP-binding cassette domain-containing protein [Carboxylicivirga sp.]
MIHTKDLAIDYKGGKQLSFKDLQIDKGQQCLLKGNSGAGKTTLLHMLSGILSPSSGTISIDDTEITKLRQVQMDKFRASSIGLIFQKNLFISSLNMYENLAIGKKVAGQFIDKNKIHQLTDELDITTLINKKPFELSQGEQQRFSIARALVNEPRVILADEATSSLDDTNCQRFIESITSICSKHEVTLLIATHDNRFNAQFQTTIQLA